MNDFDKEVIGTLRQLQRVGVIRACTELNRLAEPMVPQYKPQTGLRGSMKVRDASGGETISAEAVTGNEKTAAYINAQYYGFAGSSLTPAGTMRHAGGFDTGLLSFSNLYRDFAGAKRVTGKGQNYLYGRAYRIWRKTQNPAPMEAPLWYDRVMNNPEKAEQVRQEFLRPF